MYLYSYRMYYNPAMASRSLLRCFLPVLFIGLLFPAAELAGKKKPPAQPINLNTATSEELQLVPGIGPVTAGKILQMRKSYGSFKSVDDLLAIRGLGPKRLDKMRKYLTVGKVSPPKALPQTMQPASPPSKPSENP
jgi:competence ComEA-like helix-hairpin-helix protein